MELDLEKHKEYYPNPMRNEVVEVAVLDNIMMDPTLSTKKLSDVSGVPRTTLSKNINIL